jgi:hypothetical protein
MLTHAPSAPRGPSVAHLPSVARAQSAACVLAGPRVPVVSITMTDLWAELNDHHGGEDSRITIERQRKSCCNVEGHNLERDFDSLTA